MNHQGLSGLEGQLGGGRKKKKKEDTLAGTEKQRTLKEVSVHRSAQDYGHRMRLELVTDAQHGSSGNGDAVVTGEISRLDHLDVSLL